MELKDVIHFYLGCPVLICKNILGEDVIEPLTRKMLYEDIDVADMFFDPEDKSPYRLILRPLQYATEEEIEHILWLISDSEVHLDKESRISKEDVAGCIESIEPDDNAVVVNYTLICFVGKLYLSSHSGNLRLYDENDEEQLLEWKPELYQYLISKGFDIFNLIGTDQAIDATTINLQQQP